MQFYRGHEPGQTPGILPGPPPDGPYFWWQAGALWGAMVDYWRYTGDDEYNRVVSESLLAQVGPGWDFMPPNITATIGNDDQVSIRSCSMSYQVILENEMNWFLLDFRKWERARSTFADG